MNSIHGGKPSSHTSPFYDFSANISPLGMHPAAVAALSSFAKSCIPFSELSFYPDSGCKKLISFISKFWNVPLKNIVCAAGAADIIYSIAAENARRENSSRPVLIIEPAFSEYRSAVRSVCADTEIISYVLSEKSSFCIGIKECSEIQKIIIEKKPSLLFAASPSNPAGTVISLSVLEKILLTCKKCDTILVVDACFAQFDCSAEKIIRTMLEKKSENNNLIIINAFTKFYGMAGMRLGYAICFPMSLAKRLALSMPPWPVTTEAQSAGCAVLKSEIESIHDCLSVSKWTVNMRSFVLSEKKRVCEALSLYGAKCVCGKANFILCFAGAKKLDKFLLKSNIVIRSCSDFIGLGNGWFRIAVRTKEENDILVSALMKKTLRIQPANCAVPIMIQGTMSNAGKSLIAAAFCRIFKQDGFNVVPFKSQNMALNSGVTSDGLEMGRAQIMQAQAADVEPDVHMNPVLLKPCGDTKSQVILNGKVLKTMDAAAYFKFRKNLIPAVRDAYKSLAQKNDIVVIEGAGSPAEINLRENDIANMGMARIADSPVILVGDIDRGGVFAGLFGTVSLLEENDRRRIKGIIINKFRGDINILKPGIEQIESLLNIPVLGVVPYIKNIHIDDEDSLSSEDKTVPLSPTNVTCALNIVIVRLPYLSNGTDFSAFEHFDFVHLSYISSKDEYEKCVSDYGKADMIVLPGTKNTFAALRMLHASDIYKLIISLASSGVPVIGVCGGYQLLGCSLHDPSGSEDSNKIESKKALSLLPVDTFFSSGKRRRIVRGTVPECDGFFEFLSNLHYSGYEIHQGVSRIKSDDTACKNNKFPGCINDNVLGTYVHGFFDSDEIVYAVLNILLSRRGVKKINLLKKYKDKTFSYEKLRQNEYDRLANVVRSSIDMKAVYSILKQNGLICKVNHFSKKNINGGIKR